MEEIDDSTVLFSEIVGNRYCRKTTYQLHNNTWISCKSASSPVVPGEFWRDVSRKACWENSPRPPGNKWRSKAKCLTSAKENGNHISFLPSTMLLKCMDGMYLAYTSVIFPDRRRKMQIFVEQYLGLFSRWIGTFFILSQAFSLSRSVPSLLLLLG